MVRITSNYARLALTFALGIIIVRLMAELGPDAVLIYLLLISSTGIAALLKFALQNALVPALGLSIDGRGEHSFPTVLWTSLVFGVVAGFVSLLLFGIFWMFSSQLNLGELSQRTISIALFGTAIQAFSSSIGMVFLNLILVERRIVIYNVLQVLDRAVILLAAVVAFQLPAGTSIDTKVQIFYVLGSALLVALQIATYVVAVARRPDLQLRRTALNPDTNRWIGAFIGWNVVVVIAFAFFTRWPTLVVNWSLGEAMTLTIGIVLTVIGYQRQISMGLVVGLDALVARLSSDGKADGQMNANALILRSTYTLSAFSAFSVCALGLFIEPILMLWFGDTLTGTGWTPATSASLFRIMSFGIAASILAEGWMKFLSGQGNVSTFAPSLLLAGLVNMIGVFIAVTIFDGEAALRTIAIVFSASFVVVNLAVIALKTARGLGVTLWQLYAVIAVPVMMAALAGAPGIVMLQNGWHLWNTLSTLTILGVAALITLVIAPKVLSRLGH